MFVAGVFIHGPQFVEVFLFAREMSHLGKDRSSHLDGVDPPPFVHLRCIGEHVNIGPCLAYLFCVVGADVVKVQVDLPGAVIVGMPRGGAAMESPLMEVGPSEGVFVIFFKRIDGIHG